MDGLEAAAVMLDMTIPSEWVESLKALLPEDMVYQMFGKADGGISMVNLTAEADEHARNLLMSLHEIYPIVSAIVRNINMLSNTSPRSNAEATIMDRLRNFPRMLTESSILNKHWGRRLDQGSLLSIADDFASAASRLIKSVMEKRKDNVHVEGNAARGQEFDRLYGTQFTFEPPF
jgi:hypothetical protein